MRNVAQDEELGRRVKALRALRGWSQAALARRAHVDRRTISRLERGAGVLPMTIRTVGRLLGVQFNDEPTDEQGALGLVIDLDGYDEGSSYGADPQRAPLPGSDAPEHHPNAPLSGSESTQQRPGPPDAA